MTLTTHAVVGAAVASLLPAHPVLGVSLAFCSHFFADSIPHWDYPISSHSVNPSFGEKMRIDKLFFLDMSRIGFDALLGLVLALFFFSPLASFWLIFFGAVAGMLPDPLQFAYAHFKHEPLVSLQRFHLWMHSKNHLENKQLLGVVTQLLFLIGIIVLRTRFL
jgi:hypothetical protein